MKISGGEIVFAGAALVLSAIVGVAFYHTGGQEPSTSKTSIVEACSAADFTISDLTAQRRYEFATFKGKIASRCASAAIVRLRLVTHNLDGTTSSFPFYANNGNPIGPDESYLFDRIEELPPGNPSFEVIVDRVSPG